MDESLYQRFVELKSAGQKDEAGEAARRFVGSFASFEEKESWAREFLGRGDFGHKIRHEIYREVIFPVLERGFHASDFDSLMWLARTVQNLCSARDLHERVGFLGENQFLRRAFEIRQDDNLRRRLLHKLVSWVNFCQHEWPLGILGAVTIEECQIIERELQFARELDVHGEHEKFFDEFESKLNQYRERLRAREPGPST